MIRDCAGLDSSEEDAAELVSAGPGEGGSGSTSSAVVAIGSEDNLLLCVSPDLMFPLPLPPRFLVVKTEPLLEDVFRIGCGRGVTLSGVPGVLPSFRGRGESFLTDSEEGG